jgi:hypothetical protein
MNARDLVTFYILNDRTIFENVWNSVLKKLYIIV